MLQYLEGRNTEDIDLIMPCSALERLPELQVETRDGDFARSRFMATSKLTCSLPATRSLTRCAKRLQRRGVLSSRIFLRHVEG